MKVLMICDTFLPDIGGAEIHVLELSRKLENIGYQIKICTASKGPHKMENLIVLRIPGIKGGGLRAFLYSFLATPRIAKFAADVDVIHCHYSYLMALWGCILGKILRKPTVITLHGLGTLDSSVKGSFLKQTYRLLSLLLADKIIATSDEMMDVAKRFVPNSRIVVIPNGVDTNKFKHNYNQFTRRDKIIVLSMRRLAPKNGVQYLIEAAPYIINQLPDVEFWVAGRDKLEYYLKQRVNELQITHYFRFLGNISHEKTKDIYAQADICVFPSSAESTSLACMEAMAMQKAVVASALRPYKELLGNNERGILVELFERDTSDYDAPLALSKDKYELLARSITFLAHNKEIRETLGEKARQFVCDNYDWQQIANRVAIIYESVMSYRCCHLSLK